MNETRLPSALLRWALRAYPRRWRAVREAELLSVLRDAAPGRADRPDLRTLADLVVGGWRTRWRSRPPFWRWLGYRVLDRRMGTRWQEWVRDDLAGWWWWLRRGNVVTMIVLIAADVVILQPAHVGPTSTWQPQFFAAAFILFSLVFRRRDRRRAIAKHLPSGPPPVWIWTGHWAPPRTRTRATPIIAITGAVWTVGAPFVAWALLNPSRGPISRSLSGGDDQARLGNVVGLLWVWVGVGAVLLLFALLCARGRFRRRLAGRSRGTAPVHRWPAHGLVALVIGEAAVEVAVVIGQRAEVVPGILSLALTVGVGVGPALVVLAVVAMCSERRSGLDATWRDWALATFGSSDVIVPETGGWVKAPSVVRPSFPEP